MTTLTLEGRGLDHKSRPIEQIWEWDDYTLEITHNYIQWIFPLATPSEFVSNAPLLNSATLNHLHQSEVAKRNVFRSIEVMMGFLQRTKGWVRNGDHNQLRITRIIGSSSLILGKHAAEAFLAFVLDEFRRRGRMAPNEAMDYWKRAIDMDTGLSR